MSQAQNETRRRAAEIIIMHDHSRFQLDIDRRHKRLSLSATHEKSLTHNIPGGSAPGIIPLKRFLGDRKSIRDRKTNSLKLPLVISFERFHVLLPRKVQDKECSN